MSQEKLAQILGVSRQSIISIENGRYNPSLILAYQIPKYFNKSIEYVFFGRNKLCRKRKETFSIWQSASSLPYLEL
ncbi:helix-turn-helix transcriptional regulator [Paenibacillus larvae]|nr:helix-turn-helix transcriptional regulator [Paenibacillus larvae]MDT2292484.1 helix-turn-helix transcriptional regulator [Paenibacillus larvae]MDT2304286.1 helix-turn-helix transcriptional regulator [Paenibacillus larvae]